MTDNIKGTWRVEIVESIADGARLIKIIANRGGRDIATVHGYTFDGHDPVALANLIAAAPDMAALLDELADSHSHSCMTISGFCAWDGDEVDTSRAECDCHVADILEVLKKVTQDQEPLGAEFEAVWDANVDDLYEK